MRHPVRKVYITQPWGVNEERYKRFGYKGHNGVDYRIFDNNGNRATTGDLLAPHKGTIKEKAFDANGYGWYYKIENDVEGSILAHNSVLPLNVGDNVIEGQVIGKTGNTGWSTAPHLHWGYYRFPRNRQNGYGGTINQIPLLENEEGENMSDTYKGYDLSNRDSMKVAVDVLVRVQSGEFVEKKVVDTLEDYTERLEIDKKQLQEDLRKSEFERNKLAEQLKECQSAEQEINIAPEFSFGEKEQKITGEITGFTVSASYKLKEG